MLMLWLPHRPRALRHNRPWHLKRSGDTVFGWKVKVLKAQQRCMEILLATAATILQAMYSENFQPSTPMDACILGEACRRNS